MKVFATAELAEYDGTEGRPAYVACDRVVYDVSQSFLWQGGKHQGLHRAGRDLTREIARAPHEPSFLQRCPVVGKLETSEQGSSRPGDTGSVE